MIYSLTGKVVTLTPDMAVIECGGVGYACKTTLTTVAELGGAETATLYTYLAVREDAVELFGFATKEELECFKLLTSVSGVGSKFALAILSGMTPDMAALAIASQDTASFTKIKGIGAKLAQRIVMELKDKIAKDYAFIGEKSGADIAAVSGTVATASESSDAIAALVMLGYSQSEAASAVSRLDPSLSADEMIKRALRALSSNKF